ncbi:uncharacterized protein KY384_007188 [Bacidia gigantensis]|uniref:uncharacterized protein n=1 Tax=Bacidia gigantensis TaxID=2732470 RepID=UPI001D03848A|nr:uncharacterized protein KY384_007188 [Bacidia gigantensis]KAG8528271.1 hypothetical protein KY384_007188 [Bacidia gigantensis]
MSGKNSMSLPRDLDHGDDSPPSSSHTEKGENMATENAPSTPNKKSTIQITILILALCLSVFLAALDITIITTALPTISENFHSGAGYTWIGAAYTLGEAAFTPNWGKFSDIWGRKPILQVAMATFFLGSVLSAASVNLGMLIVGRAIQGVGGGGLLTLVNIVIGDLFSMRERGKYYGFVGLTWAVAASLGPVIGGALTEKASWRWCFYINLPITGVVFVVIQLFLKLETPKTPVWAGLKAVDWLGTITIVGSTVMLLLGLEFGGITYPWNSAIVIDLIVFGVVTAIVFFLIEWKLARYPLLPLRLFATPSNVANLLACFIHGTVFIMGTFYLPLYFQGVLGAPALLSGVWLLPFVGAMSFAATFAGAIIGITGRFVELIWFGFIFLVLGFGLFIDLSSARDWPKIIIFQIIAGLGVGPNFQAPLIGLQNGVSPQDLATATSAYSFARNVAGSIGVVVGGVIFQNGFQKRAGLLRQGLGANAGYFLGGGAIASVDKVKKLPALQRDLVRSVYDQAIREIWYFGVAFAAVGLVVILGCRKTVLSKEHVEVSTGLDGEERRRRENKAASRERNVAEVKD